MRGLVKKFWLLAMTLFCVTLLTPSVTYAEPALEAPSVVVSENFDPSAILTVSPDGKAVTMATEDLKLLWADRESVRAERDALREALSVEREGGNRLMEAASRLETLTLQLNADLAREKERSRILANERWFFLLGGIALGAIAF